MAYACTVRLCTSTISFCQRAKERKGKGAQGKGQIVRKHTVVYIVHSTVSNIGHSSKRCRELQAVLGRQAKPRLSRHLWQASDG